MNEDRLNERLTQLIAEYDDTPSPDVPHELAATFDAYRTIEAIFSLLRLPANVANLVEPTADGRVRFGHFGVLKELGSGSFATVYLAYDAQLDRLVAIKSARRANAKLLQDARDAAAVRHDGIVTIYEVGEDEDKAPYIVMEYLETGSLEGLVQSTEAQGATLPIADTVQLVVDVCEALQHAHMQGLVHRDIKLQNILLDDRGRPHIADFGLALNESNQEWHRGEVSGTPLYMAPEQLRGEVHRFDGRTDIWAVGVMLYRMLTGRFPFTSGDRDGLKNEILTRDPKPPRQINPDVSPQLQEVVLRCLEKTPERRFRSAADVGDALRGAGTAAQSRKPLLIGFGMLTLAGLLMLLIPTWWVRPAQIDGQVDMLVWREGDEAMQGASIRSDDVTPLQDGDKYQITISLNRPAYVYVVALDSSARVDVLFPWNSRRSESRPAREHPLQQLTLPQRGQILDKQTPLPGWQFHRVINGVEVLYVLARRRPLSRDADLAAMFSGMTPIPSQHPTRYEFVPLGTDPDERGTDFSQVAQIDDPLMARAKYISGELERDFDFGIGIWYADVGTESRPGGIQHGQE